MDNSFDIKALANLLKDNDLSSSDDDLPVSGISKSGPGDVGKKLKVRVRGNENRNEGQAQKNEDPDAIWSLDEVPEVPYTDDILNDPRDNPEYDVSYKQAVTPEDIYLQLGNKTVMTSSCEWMVITVKMKGEEKRKVDCELSNERLELRSPKYRLSLALPHPVDTNTSSAEWRPQDQTLILTLALNRELDFANF